MLTVQTSTVVVEQAFDTLGNQLDNRKSQYLFIIIEAIACSNDLNKAEFHAQRLKEVTNSENEFFSDYNSSRGSIDASTLDHVPGEHSEIYFTN